MNTIIIENNPTWRQALENCVKKHSELALKGSFDSALSAYHVIFSEKIDLIFLNTTVTISSDLDFSKGINKQPFIILLKPEQEWVLPVDNITIIDFLKQPLEDKHLEKAVDKAIRCFSYKKQNDFFFIGSKNSLLRVAFSDVLYVKAMENFVQIVTEKETHTKLMSLKKVLEQFPNNRFMQVHRSYVVNLQEIEALEKDTIKIRKVEIPIGSRYKEQFIAEWVNKRMIIR